MSTSKTPWTLQTLATNWHGYDWTTFTTAPDLYKACLAAYRFAGFEHCPEVLQLLKSTLAMLDEQQRKAVAA